jgi:fatty acid-binding protein DegV
VGNVFVVHAVDLARTAGRIVVDPERGGAVPVLTLVAGAIKPVGVAADMAEAAAVMGDYIVEAASALRVAIGVADEAAAPLWQALEDRLQGRPEVREIVRYRIGPSVGAYTGPGTAGAFFYSSPSAS